MSSKPRASAYAALFLTVAASALLMKTGVNAQEQKSDAFSNWSNLAREQPRSRAVSEASDHVLDWDGPDGQGIHLVVKEPRPKHNASTITISRVPDGADARPVFDAAIDRARQTGASRLIIPPGRYVFRSAGARGLGQWVIANVRDLTIDGQGATLVFSKPIAGIYLSGSQRVKFTGLAIDYTMPLAGIGRVVMQDGQNALALDPTYPPPPEGKIGHVSDYDPVRRDWIQGGQRLYFSPSSPNAPKSADNHTFTSPAFKGLKSGSKMIALYHFYAGPAVEIKDIEGEPESEDIIFDGIAIHGSPGMGIVVTRMKRGFALLNSRITPSDGSASLVSAEYDGVHTLVNEGDILIAGNMFAGQGDDAINLNSPVQYILNAGPDGRTIQIANFARFYRKGDRIAFFDTTGSMTATTRLAASPKAIDSGNVELSLDPAVSGLMPKMTVRDVDLLPRRFAVLRNTVAHCQCHGVVAQIPHGLISGNTFSNTDFNGIRLITNVGQWKEGVGAFNIKVDKNILEGSGADKTLAYPFGAISVYGIGSGANVSQSAMNDFITITGNTIRGTSQGCISVSTARNVSVTGNTCKTVNRQRPGNPAILVLGQAQAHVMNNSVAP